MERRADEGNWQARGQEFEVGHSVRLVNGGATDIGRVVATWPGIGMCDVQFPHTSYRIPVESLQIVNPGDNPFISPMHEDVPGGAGISGDVAVGAPATNTIERKVPQVELVHEVGPDGVGGKQAASRSVMTQRVAQAFVKKSLYWHARDRKYRVSRNEHASGSYGCPAKACGGTLRRASYKMEDGQMVKLHACPRCLFMIRASDILDDHCAPAEGAC